MEVLLVKIQDQVTLEPILAMEAMLQESILAMEAMLQEPTI